MEVAKIEDWDPAGRLFDTAVAGQAWHWVEPVGGAATLAKALRPGGRAALFWNVYQPEDQASAAFGEISARVYADAPVNPWTAPAGSLVDGYLRLCDKAAEGMAEAGGFGAPEKWQQAWDRPYTRDEWLDVVPTLGGMNRLPADILARLLDGFGGAVDALGGSFTMNYTTHLPGYTGSASRAAPWTAGSSSVSSPNPCAEASLHKLKSSLQFAKTIQSTAVDNG